MIAFEFYNATRIVFGSGKLNALSAVFERLIG